MTQKRGILAVIGATAAIFWPGALCFGFPGVMAAYWQELFRISSAATGNIMFFILAAVGIFMYLAGRWQEKLGSRLMISIGILICGLNLLLAAYAGSIVVIYLWAFINGMACSFVYVPALTTVQRWFPARRGLVSGIVNLCFGLSAAIMSPVFFRMLNTLGYISMNMHLAVIVVLVGICAANFTEMPDRVKSADTTCQEKTPEDTVKGVLPAPSFTVKESLHTKNFWLLWFTWAMQGSAGITMVSLSVVYGLSRGLDPAEAVLILTAFNLASGLSRLLSGYLSDYIGRTLTMSITFLAAGFAYFLLPRTASFTLLLILAGVIGYAFGTLFAVSAPLVSDCFGLKHFGAIFGLVFTAYGFISGLLGPSLSGYILDISAGNFSVVFIYLGFFCFASAILVRFVKREAVAAVVPPLRPFQPFK
ncbi:MAG: MFS transporter [Bacillota bacterium]